MIQWLPAGQGNGGEKAQVAASRRSGVGTVGASSFSQGMHLRCRPIMKRIAGNGLYLVRVLLQRGQGRSRLLRRDYMQRLGGETVMRHCRFAHKDTPLNCDHAAQEPS